MLPNKWRREPNTPATYQYHVTTLEARRGQWLARMERSRARGGVTRGQLRARHLGSSPDTHKTQHDTRIPRTHARILRNVDIQESGFDVFAGFRDWYLGFSPHDS